jgi:hypothetical protein
MSFFLSLGYLLQIPRCIQVKSPYKSIEEFGKEEIIQLKYNTLFNYITEAESVKQFKDKLELYNASIEMLKDFEDKYENLYFNPERKESLRKKRLEMTELQTKIRELYGQYMKEGNRDILAAAVEIHQKEVLPLIESMRYLKYDTVEIDLYDNLINLVQKPVGLSHIDYTVGESAKVITWKKHEGVIGHEVAIGKDLITFKVDRRDEEEEEEDYLRYGG